MISIDQNISETEFTLNLMVCCCRCLEEGAQAQIMWTITEKDDMIPEGKRRNLVVFFHHISTWILTRAFPLLFFFFFFYLDLSYPMWIISYFKRIELTIIKLKRRIIILAQKIYSKQLVFWNYCCLDFVKHDTMISDDEWRERM